MQVNASRSKQWENLIDTIDKDQIPLDCVKKILLKLNNNKQKTINLSTLRKQGMQLGEIEIFISRSLLEMSENIVNIDFIIDIKSVAEYIQPITDELLGKLCK